MHEFLQLEQILTVLTDFLEFITNLLLMKTGLLLHIAILKVYFLELTPLDIAVHNQYPRLLVFLWNVEADFWVIFLRHAKYRLLW